MYIYIYKVETNTVNGEELYVMATSGNEAILTALESGIDNPVIEWVFSGMVNAGDKVLLADSIDVETTTTLYEGLAKATGLTHKSGEL